MIWEPFVLALVLGLIISAGLYFAYLWPSVEPIDEPSNEPAVPGDDAAASGGAAAPAPNAPDPASAGAAGGTSAMTEPASPPR